MMIAVQKGNIDNLVAIIDEQYIKKDMERMLESIHNLEKIAAEYKSVEALSAVKDHLALNHLEEKEVIDLGLDALSFFQQNNEKFLTLENQNKIDAENTVTSLLNVIEAYIITGKYDYAEIVIRENKKQLIEYNKIEIANLFFLVGKIKRSYEENNFEETINNVENFIELSKGEVVNRDYHVFSLYVQVLKVVIQLKDKELATFILNKTDEIRNKTCIRNFDFQIEEQRIMYYKYFYKENDGFDVAQTYYGKYYREAQKTVKMLRNAYTSNLAMKIKLHQVEDEKKNVVDINHKLMRDMELDSFTKLYNKTSTKFYIENALREKKKNGLSALLIVDIDNFKEVNDKFGHYIGDNVIEKTAKILKEPSVSGSIVGRVGGDEFVVFISEAHSGKEVEIYGESLLQRMNSMDIISEYTFNLSLSIGVYLVDEFESYENVFQKADKALYISKENGGNKLSFYKNE